MCPDLETASIGAALLALLGIWYVGRWVFTGRR